jgi:uncharacterized protein with FMN-binding domain
MKKFLLSFGLIVVFAFYAMLSSSRNAVSQIAAVSGTSKSVNLVPPTIASSTKVTTSKAVVAKPTAKTVVSNGDDEDGGYYTTASTPVLTPPPVAIANTGKFKNGTFNGPAVDAYYGNVQVSAIIQGGALTDVQFLQYPNDRSNSIRINTRAMPILKSEAIQAQSVSVNGVSGATATSDAFVQSLGSALATALN